MAGETPTSEALGPCTTYAGTHNASGYGVLPEPVNGSRLAHRAALAEHLGRPVNGVVMHLCDNPPCINPAHLREGTQAENHADMVAKDRQRGGRYAQTTCAHGHRLTPDNVRLKPNPSCRSGYERICRTCDRRRNSEQAARRKAARAARRSQKETANGR